MSIVDIPGLIRVDYRLYPLADTLTDKVMAITEHHRGRSSTRFRDLIDIVLIAHDQPVTTQSLAAAFASERHRRELPDTPRLLAPDANVWRTGYARIARDLPELTESTLDQALKLTHVFIDPVLSGERACDVWNPDTLTWQPSTPPNAAP